MKIASIVWNENTEEAEIKFSSDYNNSYWILKMDALQDSLVLLNDEYKKVRNDGRAYYEKINKKFSKMDKKESV